MCECTLGKRIELKASFQFKVQNGSHVLVGSKCFIVMVLAIKIAVVLLNCTQMCDFRFFSVGVFIIEMNLSQVHLRYSNSKMYKYTHYYSHCEILC